MIVNALLALWVLAERAVEWAAGLLDREVPALLVLLPVLVTGGIFALGMMRGAC